MTPNEPGAKRLQLLKETLTNAPRIATAEKQKDYPRSISQYKVAKGAKPEALPVEQPTRFELVINANSVKSLGLTSPQSSLLRADQVME